MTVVADAGMVSAANRKAIEERPYYSKTEVRAAAILILAELFGKAADDTVS